MRLIIGIIFLTSATLAFGQGCSDAGFCTMGAMKPDQNYSKRIAIKLRSLEVNYYRGTTTLTPIITVATVDFNLALSDRSSLQIKVPYQHIKGTLGENSGLSDIVLSFTKNIKIGEKWSWNGTLGTKIPTNDANATVNNNQTGGVDAPIHMYYQTSLGSFDAIAGVSAISSKWLFATGIQVALNENGNQFVWGNFPNVNQEYREKYDIGLNLKRGTDIMFRAERNWRFTNFNFSLGVLPIYRITKDEVTNRMTGERVRPDGTTGLALSVLGSFGYHFDVNNSIKIIQGIKLTDREFNPDGLTRNEVFSVSYVYKF
ncbi:MAG: hypothetical protein AB8B73_00785 [Ekhidna sp.]